MNENTHLALYRRFRPQRFGDITGQAHVVAGLRNSVRDNETRQAYLFSGPRGTGKTSMARIFAKALNCENVVDGEPCGTCETCTSIADGSAITVRELDAASRRSIDDVRELIGQVGMATGGKNRVFIIDEVHMLTPQAAAALLKTLEEPPPNVVFVLATTDPQKVIDTIRSRTQHYQFKLLTDEELLAVAEQVNSDANLGLSAETLRVVVRQGRGSARDMLSALDLAAATGGAVDDLTAVYSLVDALCDHSVANVLSVIAEVASKGQDLRVFAEELIAHLRNVLLLPMSPGVVQVNETDIERVRGQASRLGAANTTRAMTHVSNALRDMRNSRDPRIPLEHALIQACTSVGMGDADILGRLETLENRFNVTGFSEVSNPVAPSVTSPQIEPSTKASEVPEVLSVTAPDVKDDELVAQPEAEPEPLPESEQPVNVPEREPSNSLSGMFGNAPESPVRPPQTPEAQTPTEEAPEALTQHSEPSVRSLEPVQVANTEQIDESKDGPSRAVQLIESKWPGSTVVHQ